MTNNNISNNQVFKLKIPLIRLGEFDLGGVLYHSNYFHIYEQTREAFLEHNQYPYSLLVEKGCHLPVVESHQVFTKPVRYGMPLEIRMHCDLLKRSSLRLVYNWYSEDNILIHEAWTRHAFVQSKNGHFRVAPLTPELKAILNRYLIQST